MLLLPPSSSSASCLDSDLELEDVGVGAEANALKERLRGLAADDDTTIDGNLVNRLLVAAAARIRTECIFDLYICETKLAAFKDLVKFLKISHLSNTRKTR